MTLTLSQAKGALESILSELDRDQVKSAILAARQAAGTDMALIMQEVVPFFFEVKVDNENTILLRCVVSYRLTLLFLLTHFLYTHCRSRAM